MGQILHQRATTTERIRKEIQDSTESIATLAKRYGINPKTVIKWRKRSSVQDAPMGSKTLRTVLTPEDEMLICQFRKSTWLALDDCYQALKPSIAKLSRSNLHRCLRRHGLHIKPVRPAEEASCNRTRFKDYALGFVHIDISTIHLGKRKYYLFVAIERLSKFAYAELHAEQTLETAVGFLKQVIEQFPFKIHRILTDNGAQFTYALLAEHLRPKRRHPFDVLCQKQGIKHKLTQFRHPWTNGQVERFNGTLKENTVKQYHYETLEELKGHLHDFLMAYNYARKLKSLKFLTPFEKLREEYKLSPKNFLKNPDHYLTGLNK